MERIPCTVEILTRNSAKTLQACLDSVKEFAEILVIDGNSTDDTVAIAKRAGVTVLKQVDTDEPEITITDFAAVRNIGLSSASYDWFLFVDSDEYLSKEVVDEIRNIIAHPPKERAFWLPRKYVIDGVIYHRASSYPNRQMRFFHREAVTQFHKNLHERILLKPETVIGTLTHPEFVPLLPVNEYKEKIAGYAKHQVEILSGATKARQFKSVRANIVKWVKRLILIILSYIKPGGRHIPFAYEWTDMQYHLNMSFALIKQILRSN